MNTNKKINPIKIDSSEKNKKYEVFNFANKFDETQLSSFNLIRFIVNPQEISDLDQHEVKEYWYFAKGNGLLYIDGQEVAAKEGEVYFFDSLVSHQVKNVATDSRLEILSIWW